jgi:hypothetical protein
LGALSLKNGIIAVAEDPHISRFLATILKRKGYQVIGDVPARMAERIRVGEETVDMVITNSPADFMPVGLTLPMLYIAATPDLEMASHFAYFRALKKPFLPSQLLDAVGALTHEM